MTRHIVRDTRRKNFLPTLIITILLWFCLGALVYFIQPGIPGALVLFFVLVFFTLLFTFSIIFANTRRGILASSVTTLFALLVYFGIGNFLNLFLLLGIGLTLDVYFVKNKKR